MKIIPWWVKLLAVLALVGAVYVGWQRLEESIYQRGFDAAVAERKQQDDEHLAKATKQAQATERALRERMDSDSLARQTEKVAYEKTIDDLRADARRGAVRMRAPAACVRADAKGADPAATSGPGPAEEAYLLPEATDVVLDVASGGAKDVRDYNALVALYNQMRATCNASP